jgi:hypothetical protein
LRFEAALPLAPLVRLLYAEVERQVRVEYMELGRLRLMSAHDLVLSLYIEARKGVLAKVEVTAHLRIHPGANHLELLSINAHGLNAAGRAASAFYLNPKVFKPLRHMRLFDASTLLPPEARVESFALKSVSPDTLVLIGAMTFAVS